MCVLTWRRSGMQLYKQLCSQQYTEYSGVDSMNYTSRTQTECCRILRRLLSMLNSIRNLASTATARLATLISWNLLAGNCTLAWNATLSENLCTDFLLGFSRGIAIFKLVLIYLYLL